MMKGFVNNKVIPLIIRFTNTKIVQALKDGMMYVMPFLIIGSFFLLLANLPIPAVATWITDSGLAAIFTQIYSGTFNLMAFFAVCGIAYVFIRNEGVENRLPGALTALACFVILSPSTAANEEGAIVDNVISRNWTSGQGMITAIIVGILVGYLYSYFVHKDIRIKMPDGVPQGVADSFSALVPSALTVVIVGVIYAVVQLAAKVSFSELIYSAIQQPLQGVTDSLGGVIIMTILMSVLWWFGVHGGNICGAILSPILQSNAADNQKIIDSGKALTVANGGHIFTQQFWDNFLCMTGAGIVIGLVLFIVFVAKAQQLHELGKLALLPNIFNISEPVMFGVPIVMNLYLLIPFLVVPLVVGIASYLLMSAGILPLFGGVMVPWTTPPVISGFLIGGWRTALWQLVIIAFSILAYWPFAKAYDRSLVDAEKQVA